MEGVPTIPGYTLESGWSTHITKEAEVNSALDLLVNVTR